MKFSPHFLTRGKKKKQWYQSQYPSRPTQQEKRPQKKLAPPSLLTRPPPALPPLPPNVPKPVGLTTTTTRKVLKSFIFREYCLTACTKPHPCLLLLFSMLLFLRGWGGFLIPKIDLSGNRYLRGLTMRRKAFSFGGYIRY